MHAHRNVPGMMMRLNEIFMNADCNVTAQFLQTDGEIGYVVIEADTGGNTELDDRLLQDLRGMEGTIRARLIYKGK